MGGNRRKPSSRLGGLRGVCGGDKIVEIHGGRIVRSTGRKDRHSKVYTAKGPRDRRVRLSAHTAIQFYDVQDRLGYDRPSKAVDWLINKARIAIDELEKPPPWSPLEEPHRQKLQEQIPTKGEEDDDGDFEQLIENGNGGSGFWPPSLESDAIADAIKSFFPVTTRTASSPMLMQYQSYPSPPPPDLPSRTASSQSQDLRLSLQSLVDPFLLHHRNQIDGYDNQQLFDAAAAASLGYAPSSTAATPWSDHQYPDIPDILKFQKIVGWNTGGADAASATISGGGGGFVFSLPQPVLQPVLDQSSQLSFQRGPLQSSYEPPIRAWLEPTTVTDAATAAEHHFHQTPSGNPLSLISGMGFAPGMHSGFQIPARIRGEEEHIDHAANKPSSVSSDSRH